MYLLATLQISVESDCYLAVKPKIPKLTYAEAARVNDVVEAQDRLIANGSDPTVDLDWLTATGLDRLTANGSYQPTVGNKNPITGLLNVDIKKK